MLNGFDDQFYRLLAMTLRPDHFLSTETAAKTDQSVQKQGIMARFESHVEDNIDKPIVLSELEAVFGVTARTLQYACMKLTVALPASISVTGNSNWRISVCSIEAGLSSWQVWRLSWDFPANPSFRNTSAIALAFCHPGCKFSPDRTVNFAVRHAANISFSM